MVDKTEKQNKRCNLSSHEYARQGTLYITDCHFSLFTPPLSLCLTQNWPWSQSALEGHWTQETLVTQFGSENASSAVELLSTKLMPIQLADVLQGMQP